MLIVDPAFRQQFDIARPSPRYRIILKSLPNTFVGRLSDLQSLVDIMVAEIRKSFELEEAMRKNPDVVRKLRKLSEAGLLNMEWKK